MQFGDLIGTGTRLYAKSEWAPAGPDWPALSFSRRAAANAFSGIYSRGADFVITVGTGDPKDTLNPAHRQRLLSAVDVEPKVIVSTADLVDSEAWKTAQLTHPDRWKLSMPIARCWTFADFPEAKKDMATTYKHFGNPTMRGRPIPIERADLPTLRALTLEPVNIPSVIESRLKDTAIPTDILLNRELTRIVTNITNAVARAGTEHTGFYPPRHTASFSDLFQLLRRIWDRQGGRCNLCSGPIDLQDDNLLLKMSPDRIDSANKSYTKGNVHLRRVDIHQLEARLGW